MSLTLAEKKTDRIEVIDVLRGFALLGIIIVHMTEQYYAGVAPEQYANFTTHNLLDNIVQGIVGMFIIGKFYMIFSFLFGLSFYLQLSKTDGSAGFIIRFAWRLLILFGIGMLHHLHYRGDILSIYAILGFGLLIFYRLPDKYLLVVALLLTLNVPSLLVRGYEAFFLPPTENPWGTSDQNVLLRYYETLKSGTYPEILRANLGDFVTKFDFQFSSGRIYITLGLFLLGLYAGRKKIFENLTAYIPFIKKLLRISLWSLLACFLFSIAFFGGAEMLKIKLSQIVQWMVGGFMFDLLNTALAAIYMTGVLLLFHKEKWKNRFLYLYPVGRMGMTTYLMQSLFGFFIYFNVGLGLLGEIGSALAAVLALVLFAVQIAFARIWFQYFRYGLFEWIWRCLTYFRIYPLRKSKADEASNPTILAA